jgi:hypothetical protein
MAQRLARKTSLLFLCDMQDKFRSTIKYFPQIVQTSNKLLQVCKILDVPFVVTEQYPKGMSHIVFIIRMSKCVSYHVNIGLGRTVPELDIGNVKPFEKTLFSMCTSDVVGHMKHTVKGTRE